MEDKKVVVNTNLDIVRYVTIVKNLAREFFDDDDGSYCPYFGTLNAMRVFYNECVTESDIDLSHDVTDVLEIEKLVADREFIVRFNEAIRGDGLIQLDFANAYREALDIVEANKTSIGRVINMVKGALSELGKQVAPLLTEDNIDKISKLADQVTNGNFNPEELVKAYGNSERFQSVIKGA